MKINIDGEYYWRWIVSEFVDDSFLYERMVNPIECTDKIETMLESIEDD